MTDKFKGWYPDYIENEKEREPILKLAKMMTGRAKKKLGLEKMTKYDPEYWGLALLCTDEQAEIALKMGVRQPKTLDQMVKVTGKDRGYLEKQLEEMAEVALVEYNWENPQHEKQYVLPIFVPGSAEFSCMNAKMLEKQSYCTGRTCTIYAGRRCWNACYSGREGNFNRESVSANRAHFTLA